MDPFAHQARQYLLSRPTYPDQFLTKLALRVGHNRSSCLDVGCGSGQLTVRLTEIFDKVIGVDRSKAQLEQAVQHERIQYIHVADAVTMSHFQEASFNCVTIAQTLHWLPLSSSLNEFSRILTPGGVFAAMGYGVCRIANSPAAQAVFRDYYINTLGSEHDLTDSRCKWDCDRRRLDTGHAGEIFSPPFVNLERTWSEDERKVPGQEFLSYLTTWSAYQKLSRSEEWTGKDPLEPLRIVLQRENRVLSIVFPFWLIIGSKPTQSKM